MEKFTIESAGDLLKLTICKNANINKQTIKILYRVLGDEKRNLIIKLEPSVSMEKDARDFMKRIEKLNRPNPLTIVADTFNENLLVSFYNNFYVPMIPIKMFRYENEALKWLASNTKMEQYNYSLN